MQLLAESAASELSSQKTVQKSHPLKEHCLGSEEDETEAIFLRCRFRGFACLKND